MGRKEPLSCFLLGEEGGMATRRLIAFNTARNVLFIAVASLGTA